MGRTRRPSAGKPRARHIEYYVVVDGTPNPDVLRENYIWCLQQRELVQRVKEQGDGGEG